MCTLRARSASARGSGILAAMKLVGPASPPRWSLSRRVTRDRDAASHPVPRLDARAWAAGSSGAALGRTASGRRLPPQDRPAPALRCCAEHREESAHEVSPDVAGLRWHSGSARPDVERRWRTDARMLTAGPPSLMLTSTRRSAWPSAEENSVEPSVEIAQCSGGLDELSQAMIDTKARSVLATKGSTNRLSFPLVPVTAVFDPKTGRDGETATLCRCSTQRGCIS